MIDLKVTTGLDIQFNNDRRRVIVSDNLVVSAIAQKTLRQMQSVIINDNLICPEIFYTIYAHLYRRKDTEFWSKSGLVYDLTFMLPNLAGIEYIKTYGHYNDISSKSPSGAMEIIEVAYGSGVIILQKPTVKNPKGKTIEEIYNFAEIEEMYIIKVVKGDKLVVPPGFAYVVINTKSTLFAIGTLSAKDRRPICDPLFKLHGAGYYLIRKNARQEIVKNPHYLKVPKMKKSKVADFNKIVGFKTTQPLYMQALKFPERFEWLFSTKGFIE